MPNHPKWPVPSAQTAGPPRIALEARSVSYAYGTRQVLRGIRLAVREGSATALLGPNGAGKSTLLNCLLGVYAPTAGEVRLLDGPPDRAIERGQVGVMPQSPELPRHTTVRELLAYLSALHGAPKSQLREAAKRAGIVGLIARRTEALSPGERRWVQFAAALLGNPAILVLDEPTEGMDLESRQHFWETVRAGHRDGWARTILFSTHDLSEADRFADRIALVSAGRLVAEGTPQQLKADRTRHTVRFRLASSVSPDAIGQILQTAVLATQQPGRYEIRVDESDGPLRQLVGLPGVFDLEVHRGSLDDVFRSVLEAGPCS